MSILDLMINDNKSPNCKFYFQYKEPESLNPSAFGSKIAFYDTSHNLLYHYKDAFAHELNEPALVAENRAIMNGVLLDRNTPLPYRLRIATWSRQGNMAHILEYFRYDQTYYNVLINLHEQYYIRVLYAIGHQKGAIDDSTLTKIGIFRPNFDEIEVLKTFDSLGLNEHLPLRRDPIHRNIFTKILPINRWHK